MLITPKNFQKKKKESKKKSSFEKTPVSQNQRVSKKYLHKLITRRKD